MSTNNAWKAKTKHSRKTTVTQDNKRRQRKDSREEAKFIREYEELLPGSPRRKAPYKEPKTIGGYAAHLRGPSQNKHGGHQSQRMRGFRGNTYGAAGPCHTFTAEEKAKVEADLRAQGFLPPEETEPGPAGPCRRLTAEEKAKEAELKAKGIVLPEETELED
jgi:hypothetical protein